MDSILTSVKKVIGVSEEDEHFDADIIMHINTVLAIMTQMGVGSSSGFSITDKTKTWTDYIPAAQWPKLEFIKSYVGLKVRLLFDPPTGSTLLQAMKDAVSELEWRIFEEVDPIETTV